MTDSRAALRSGSFTVQAQAKQSFAHRLFVPRSVILDPAATLHTPAGPATEPLSLQGLRLLGRALQNIKADPRDLEARLDRLCSRRHVRRRSTATRRV